MPASKPNHRRAINHLKRADPVLAAVIESVGPCRFAPRAEEPYLGTLVHAIINQQLSGKAAATIHGRLLAIYGGRSPTAEELAATPDDALRAAGVSRQKIGYLRDMAARVHSGEIPIEHLDELDDAAIIEYLTRIKGIGKWTVQMFLMFRLGRPDVLPDLDLGIQNAIRKAYRMRKHPKPKDVQRIGAKWSPYATVASWYLWRSLDNR